MHCEHVFSSVSYCKVAPPELAESFFFINNSYQFGLTEYSSFKAKNTKARPPVPRLTLQIPEQGRIN